MSLVVPISHVLMLAGLLFGVGLFGVLIRRNIIFMLISLELMMSAASLAFVGAGARWNQADGQVMYLIMLALAACEVAVGLALVLQLERRLGTLDIDAARDLNG